MSFVVVVKTAEEQPLWPGIHRDFPVACEEFGTIEEAMEKWPGKLVLTTELYAAHAKYYHDTNPRPETAVALVPLLKNKRWWEYLLFWRKS